MNRKDFIFCPSKDSGSNGVYVHRNIPVTVIDISTLSESTPRPLWLVNKNQIEELNDKQIDDVSEEEINLLLLKYSNI